MATLYLVNPLRLHGNGASRSIPILMYHSVADEDETGVQAYFRTATAPRVFAQQMASLHDDGYSVIGLGDAVRRLKENDSTATRSVVITFDDGYHNFYTNAFPAMNRYGFTATMFLPTSYMGQSRLSFNGRECMSWSEVRELHKSGISFGSHTVTHPQLHDLGAEAVREEVTASKQTIEQALGCAVESFGYPYAFPETDREFKARLRDTLGEAGYTNGVCTTLGRPGPGSDEFFLKRLPVNSGDDVRLFQAKLAGAYDWLAKPQYLAKLAKSWLEVVRQ
jgi:peptidoglycan/xylan/chitin deacetylase (PgdA/CDA1 family)